LSTPDLTELTKIEAEILSARLKTVRASISHAGEKGRDLEFHVRRLLRDLLPAEYGVTTGFVAYVENDKVKLSSQLDIIIYDAVRSSPLIRLESSDVLPLEAVYGYVEVKSTLRSSQADELPHDSIESIIKRMLLSVRCGAARTTTRSRAAHLRSKGWKPVGLPFGPM